MSAVKTEREWEAHGLACEVKWVIGRHRCGYVTVPPGHPWHGIDYGEPAPTEPLDNSEFEVGEDINIVAALAYGLSDEDERAKRSRTPEFQIAVHGGLTYSRSDGEGWVFGFDCAHAGDLPEVWTLERTVEECERLAEQLAAIGAVR